MFRDIADRELCEQEWSEYQEWLWEENLFDLWQAAQEKARLDNDEALAILASGDGEKEGIF